MVRRPTGRPIPFKRQQVPLPKQDPWDGPAVVTEVFRRGGGNLGKILKILSKGRFAQEFLLISRHALASGSAAVLNRGLAPSG